MEECAGAPGVGGGGDGDGSADNPYLDAFPAVHLSYLPYGNQTSQPETIVAGLSGGVEFSMLVKDFTQPWFHPTTTRRQAVAKLRGCSPGTFLVRPSSQRGCYAMSWAIEGSAVKHNLIYGLFPGFALSEKPAVARDVHWTLTSLVGDCEYLKVPLAKSEASPSPSAAQNKSGIELIDRVASCVGSGDPACSSLSWTLCTMASREPSSRHRVSRGPSSLHCERRTYVRFANEEHVAPEFCPLRGSEAKLVLNALRHNTTLLSLVVQGTQDLMRTAFTPCFCDEEAVLLADALRCNSTLTSIDLCTNAIGDKGAEALSTALASLSTLRSLDLSNNFIGAAGLCSVAKLVHVHDGLERVRVGNQLLYDAVRRSVMLSRAASSRALCAHIHHTFSRRLELLPQRRAPSVARTELYRPVPFYGHLGAHRVDELLRGKPAGTFLCYLRRYRACTLMLAYSSGDVVHERVVYPCAHGYTLHRRYSEYRVPPLQDMCLWMACSDPSLYAKFAGFISPTMKTRMERLSQLYCIWRATSVEDLESLSGGIARPDVSNQHATLSQLIKCQPYLVQGAGLS